jgi:hypothetical protein
MTFNDFLSLTQDRQIELLKEQGVIVSNREHDGCKFELYQILNFYVEMRYRNKTGELLTIRKFKCTNLLEPHLEKISIKNIFKKASIFPLSEIFELEFLDFFGPLFLVA